MNKEYKPCKYFFSICKFYTVEMIYPTEQKGIKERVRFSVYQSCV